MRPLFCVKCGNRLTNEQALFCEKCGARIEDVIIEDKAVTGDKEISQAENSVSVETVETAEQETSTENSIPVETVAAVEPEVIKPATEKKTVPTWLVAVLVFVTLMIVTGVGVLTMYLKKDILPSINPWYVEKNYEDELSDAENTEDIDATVAVDSDNSDLVAETIEGKDADANPSDDDQTDINDNDISDSTETVAVDASKEYVAGDDTKGNELHRYEIVIDDVNWGTAQAFAETYGEKAYLLHINSDEEYEYICNRLKNEYSGCIFWIGAKREQDEYVYKWVNAKGDYAGDNLLGLSYWLTNEPSFYDVSISSNEDCVNFFYSKSEGRYVMNDVPGNILDFVPSYSGKIGYIVEIED